MRLRSCTADRMPTAANRLAAMSPIEAPTRDGGRCVSPVRLIMPDIAWITASNAGRSRYGPVCPNPDTLA